MYDRDGRVVAGPPPRPLDRLPVRVNPQTSEIEVQL
jgi:Rieske Fe-S protein